MTARAIDGSERRARLAVRHHLAPARRARRVVEVAHDLVGLHATDPATVYLAARARLRRSTIEAVEDALYTARSVVRVLGMRHTLFVVPVELAPLLQHGCSATLGRKQRDKLIQMIEDQGLAPDGAAWLADVEARTLAALEARGEAVARELTSDVAELKSKLRFGGAAAWAGEMGVSTRVLFLLATEGRIIRGRPRGSWLSSQYRWVPLERWLGRPIPDMSPEAARAALAGRWLASFGPGTLTDLKWWTGWSVRHTREALAAVDAREVDLEEGTGFVLPDDVDAPPTPGPWVALLPALDPTPMGWKDRDWYLGDHAAALFDRSGNIGPTVWADGRAVGGWAQQADGSVVYRFLEPVGSDHAEMVAAEAGRLEAWLQGTIIKPRFRTPVERELTG